MNHTHDFHRHRGSHFSLLTERCSGCTRTPSQQTGGNRNRSASRRQWSMTICCVELTDPRRSASERHKTVGCRSTVRGAGVKAPRRTRGNPSRARLHTTCSKPHLAAQAFGTERRYCGASNRGKHQGATVGRPARPSGTRKLFRNGSQCPRARERQVPCGAGPRFFGWEGQPRR